MSPSISLRAFWTAVPASPLVESSTTNSTLRPSIPPLALICSTARCNSDLLVLAEGGVGSGQGVVHPDLDAVGGARALNEGTRDLGRGDDEARPQQVAARNRIHDALVGHFRLPIGGRSRQSSRRPAIPFIGCDLGSVISTSRLVKQHLVVLVVCREARDAAAPAAKPGGRGAEQNILKASQPPGCARSRTCSGLSGAPHSRFVSISTILISTPPSRKDDLGPIERGVMSASRRKSGTSVRNRSRRPLVHIRYDFSAQPRVEQELDLCR